MAERDSYQYHPHRSDGLDRNLTRLNEADYRAGMRCTCADCCERYEDSREWKRQTVAIYGKATRKLYDLKRVFIDAAAIVRNILDGNWTNDPPDWVKGQWAEDYDTDNTVRAVQTAEAFVMLFTQHNPRFDTERFLIACGLVEKAKPSILDKFRPAKAKPAKVRK